MRTLHIVIAAGLLAPAASAQFGNAWIEFKPNSGMLSGPAISNATTEVDFAAGDLDNDGRVDLVVVRKQPFTTAGKRTNLLLMNVGGVLTDRTATHASASDVAGDQGFLTPTNDRDVVIVDVDQDGFEDVVTAVTLSSGDPKHVGHPRVYRNGGVVGAWTGLRHEDARVPQLLHYGTGSPVNPRFNFVSAGDIDQDGYPELWFSDHDSSGAGGVTQPANEDLNDRLLRNDGFGFFSDQSQALMTSAMLLSGYTIGGAVVDVNGDGALDVVKGGGQSPGDISVVYNSPVFPGNFGSIQNGVGGSLTYSFATADLNNDGRLDLVRGEDIQDRYRYNLGNDPQGKVVWGAPKPFQFLAGADDGFVGPVHVVDLDGDGWRDVLIADVDLDIPGFTRRLHLYHNPGGVPGSEIVLVEERQSASSAGWIGAVGLHEPELMGTYDVVTLDIDGDGDLDLLTGRSVGTRVWENRTVVCQADLGFGGPGSATLSLCGDALATGGQADLLLSGAAPNAVTALVAGLTNQPTPFALGLLVPVPIQLFVVLSTDGQGVLSIPGIPGGGGPLSVYLQCIVVDGGLPGGYGLSNALRVELLP